MKTKLKFLKENIFLAIFWNLPHPIALFIGVGILTDDLVFKLATSLAFYLYFIFSSINNWYNDYRFEELEKQLKEKQIKP